MKNYKLILASALLATVFSCTNPDHYSAPELTSECGDLTATKSVQSIAATSSTYTHYIPSDIIEAYVTSSDEGGNFYKSLSFVSVDGTTGFSMSIDDYNLYTKYEPGRKVYVNLKDRYIVKDFGGAISGTVIGSLYNNNTLTIPGDDEVGRISGIEYKSILTASCNDFKTEEQLVQPMTITQAKSEQNLNKLIELDNVQFTDPSIGNTYFDADMNSSSFATATDHTIKDSNNTTLIVRVSSFATFATKPVPSGNGKIVGVMTKYGSTYQFMLRTERDVKLVNPRVLPVIIPPAFFDEPFTTNFASWSKYTVTGSQVWSLDTTHGNPGSCAKMSGYASSTNNANEDWLISPVKNLSTFTSATLSFDTATDFAGNPLTVLISRNYTGTGDPNLATWTTLSGVLAPTDSNYVWAGSGAININTFTGAGNNTVYIAFKYTSTSSASATWEVDNIRIATN